MNNKVIVNSTYSVAPTHVQVYPLVSLLNFLVSVKHSTDSDSDYVFIECIDAEMLIAMLSQSTNKSDNNCESLT